MSGAEERNRLIEAGFTSDEINDWEANQRKSLMQAGFSQDDIDKHFGTQPYNDSKIRSYFRSAWDATFGNDQSPTFKQAWEAGWQGSVTGLAIRGEMPDTALPDNSPIAQRVISGAGTIIGDAPAMVAGAVIGGIGGGGTGAGGGAVAGTTVAPGPGTVAGAVGGGITGAGVGAMAGSFALPAGLRAVMMDAYQNGEIDSFSRFWEALTGAVTEEFKGYVVGAATGVAGQSVRAIAGSRAAGGLTGTAATEAYAQAAAKATIPAVGAEIGTMVTVGAALEGHVPEPSEFLDAAILLGGMKASVHVAGKLRSLYTQTGVRPADVMEDINVDPTIKQDLLSSNVEIPKTYESRVEAPTLGEKVGETASRDTENVLIEDKGVAAGASPAGYKADGSEVRVDIKGNTPHHEARSFVLDKEAETGHEHMVILGADGVRWENTSGLEGSVHFPKEAVPHMFTPGAELIIHHNHPKSGGSLSSNDIAVLAFPGVNKIVAHSNGSIHYASLSAEMREALDSSNKPVIGSRTSDPKGQSGVLQSVWQTAAEPVGARIREMYERGEISRKTANEMYADQVNRALDAAGVIDYSTTNTHGLVAVELGDLVSKIRRSLKARGIDLYVSKESSDARTNRATSSMGYEAAMDALSGRDGSGKKPVTGAEASNQGSKESSSLPTVADKRTEASNQGSKESSSLPTVADKRTEEYRKEAEDFQKNNGPLEVIDDPRELRPFGTELEPSPGKSGGGGGEPPNYTDAEFSEGRSLPGPKPKVEITDPWDKVASRIDVGNHDPKEKMTLSRLYSLAVDDLHALPGKGKEAADSPYKLARLTRGSQGRADYMLEYGTFDQKTYKTNGEGLKAILRDIEKEDNGLEKLRIYGVARRVEELHASAAEREVQYNAAKGEANRARNNAEAMQEELSARKGELNQKQYRAMEAAITAWKEKASEAEKLAKELDKKRMKDDPTGVDLEAAAEVVRQGREKYEPVMRRLVDFQNRVTAYLRDSGVLSKEAYDAMVKANEQFLPFYRLLEPEATTRFGVGGGGLSTRNPIHRLKGSDLKIVDPLESVIKNVYTYVALADRNEAGVKLIDFLTNKQERALIPWNDVSRDTSPAEKPSNSPRIQKMAEGQEVVRVEEAVDRALDTSLRETLSEAGVKNAPDDLIAIFRTADTGPGKVAVFMDGKRTEWRVSKDIEIAFKNMDKEAANFIVKVLSIPARMLRAGSTVTPEFIGRNAVRDFISAFVNSKGVFTPLDTLGGLIHTLKKDEVYQTWLKSGGANAAMVSLDRRYMQENLFKLNENTGFMRSAWNVVNPFGPKGAFAMLRIASELAENATRVGEFAKIAKDGAASSKADILKAGYASREVTLDFARAGAKMRAWNMITAFANAHVQGVDRVAREARDRPVSFTLKAVAGITAPSIMLWWANKDDERWESIPRWEKDMFWIVMTDEHIYRIPKPFELGLVFGSLPERALEAMYKDNPRAFDGFGNSLFSALAPNMMPTAAAPFLEAATNYSFFMDAPIVPAYLEKELPEYRYQPYTTEIAKELSHTIGSIPGLKHSDAISPIMMENMWRDWTGGLGMHVLQILDKNLKLAGLLPEPIQPADTLADMPFIKAFVVRYPSGNAQEIRDFYDRHKKVSQVMATVKELAQQGDEEAITRELNLTPDATMKLDGIAEAIGVQSKFIREVYKMPDMTPDDKRQLIDTAYYQMIELARYGNEMAEEANKVLTEKP